MSDQARQSNWIAGSGTLFAPVESVPNLWNTATGTVLVSSQSQRQYNYKAGETGIYIFYIMTVNVSLKICSTACQCWTKACKLYWTRNTQGAFKANWKQSSFMYKALYVFHSATWCLKWQQVSDCAGLKLLINRKVLVVTDKMWWRTLYSTSL